MSDSLSSDPKTILTDSESFDIPAEEIQLPMPVLTPAAKTRAEDYTYAEDRAQSSNTGLTDWDLADPDNDFSDDDFSTDTDGEFDWHQALTEQHSTSESINRQVPKDALSMAKLAADIITDKQGENIIILDIQALTIIADYFVIGTADNTRQAKAIAREISDYAPQKRRGVLQNIDSQADSGWILLDMGDVMVHIFSGDQRDYYKLEELWRDARVVLKLQ